MNKNTLTETNATTPNPQSPPSIALAEEDPSSIALLAKEDTLPLPPIPAPAADIPHSALCPSSIALAKEGTLSSPAAPAAPALVATQPLPAPTGRRKVRRNGRVACLPKI